MQTLVCFENWTVPLEFQSDGCTIPWFARWFAKLFLAPNRAVPACRLHDFLSKHARWHGLSYSIIDSIFRRHLKFLGLRSWQATIYWFAVKIARPFRKRKTQPEPMPVDWQLLNKRAMLQYALKVSI